MNKKLILSCVYGVFALTMVGCSGQSSTISALSKQLDRTTNTVSGISSSALYSFSPFAGQQLYSSRVSSTNNATPTYRGYVGAQIYKVQSSATEQEQLRNAVLSQAAMIKSSLKGLKLSKSQMRALNDLTSNITKYTNSINNTKPDVNNTIRQIRRVNRPNALNNDEVSAHLQTLNSHMDARLAYMRNLLGAMDQVQNIISCKDCDEQSVNSNGISNIDTYAGKSGTQTQNVSNKTTNNQNGRVIPHYVGNNTNTNYVTQYNNGGYGTNGYGNGYYGANGYGYGSNNGFYGNRRFNPNRNTDTYGPRGRNIDTYRTVPNSNNGNYVYNYNNGVAQVTSQAEKDEQEEKNSTQTIENDNNKSNVKNENITKKFVTSKNDPASNGNKEPGKRLITPRNGQTTHSNNALDVNKNIEKLIRG